MSSAEADVRAALAGIGATGLALITHLLAGGSRPGVAAVTALTLTAVLACMLLGGRRWSRSSLLGFLLVSQATFHLAFNELPHVAHTMSGPHAGHESAAHHAMPGHALPWQMLTAHAIAIALTAVLIRRGEQARERAAEIVAQPMLLARFALSPPVLPAVDRPLAPHDIPVPVRARMLVTAAPRRGPPVATYAPVEPT